MVLYMNSFFNKDLILKQLETLQTWIIIDLPVIIGLLIFLIIALKLINISLNKLNKTLLKHAEKRAKDNALESEKRINTLMGILKGASKIALVTIVTMIILQKFGINIGPILASAGIVGLAVGFGAQELVRDVISGFFILLEDQIRTGDVAIINGTSGQVESIQLRTITLRDFSGTVHIFQNGKIESLANRTKEWSAAVFNIGVAYKEDITQVISVMKQTGDEMLLDPEFAAMIIEPIEIQGLDQFADSAIIIKARFKTKPSQQWAVTREYNKRLKYVFDKENIEIPFPHTTVYWGEKITPLKLDVEKSN